MKKFLLTLACVLGLGAWANATTETITFKDLGYDNAADVETVTSGDVTLTFAKGDGGNAPKYYTSGNGVRTYKNNTITFAVPEGNNIIKVEFTVAGTNYSLKDSKVSEGTLADAEAINATWTGATNSFVLTSGGTTRIQVIAVTYAELTADYVAAPTFSVKEGTYYEAQTVELAQADADAIYYTLDGTEPTAASTKYEAAIEVAKTTTIKAIAVKGENASEVAEATYTIAERAQANSIADAKLVTDGEMVINFPLTVGYAAYSNVFVTDGTDFIQIYKYGVGDGLKQGDVIPAGWYATYTLYSNATPELVPADALPAVTEGTFTAKEYEASDITAELVNSVVVIKNVIFAEATPSAASNFEGTSGDTTLTFRNNYKIDSVEAGKYDVEAVINIYSGAVQVYPISYTALDETGVSAINADSNAAVEYFNLQGVRVANPENGIYVRRQGNKVSKVVIR
jgi:hypothetical protein